jgi:hypothetical protein
MALSKGGAAISQLVASGNSASLDTSDAYDIELLYKHANGTGTITAQATWTVQVQRSGSSTWWTIAVIGGGTTASGAVEGRLPIPSGAVAVRLVYVAPIGSTSHTLDAAVVEVTGL